MNEANQSSQSMANGQSQRPVSHPRPFFYVQPPSQPYYMYQWQANNNPYNHYSLPGSVSPGLAFGRASFSPYSHMQYPGYGMPHAPMHLLDYRKMCDPHFNPAAYDAVRRHHHHGNVSKETTCSGAQTDPSDALNKLIECLDKLRASEASSERELDSGVISQASGVCSPRKEPKKEELKEANKQEPTRIRVHQASPGALFSDASTAVCEPDGSQRQREGWSVDSDGEPPLDTSSVHEKSVLLDDEEEDNDNNAHFHHYHTEQDFTSDHAQDHQVCCGETKNSLFRGFHSHLDSSQGPEECTRQGPEDTNRAAPQSELRAASVRLPFGKVLSAGVIQKDSAVKAPSVSPLSPGNPFYYSYRAPQLAHERFSVLSPSLDELSSRDEMFSTDLDEMDLFPGHVYTRGLQAHVSAMEAQKLTLIESVATCHRKHTCNTCGLRVSTAEACVSGAYCCDDQADTDEGAIAEEEVEQGCKSCLRKSTKKLPTCRTTLKSTSVQHQAKPKSRRLYCRGKMDQQEPSESQSWDYPRHKCCEALAAMTERSHRHEPKEEQHRPCREKQWREAEGLHQYCREIGGGKGLVKAPKFQPLPQRQVKRVQRRCLAKPQLSQNLKIPNPEDNDDEEEDEGEEMKRL